jgi:type II secretory pathway component PulF
MVRVGENLGSLDHVILRLADIEEKRNILKSKIQSAMMYPIFMVLFAIVVVFFLMIKIVPTLTSIFKDMGKKELPLPTEIVMSISSFLSSYWIFIVLIAGVAVFLVKRYIDTEDGRKKYDELKLKIPMISKIYNKMIVQSFTQNLGILLSSNVDIIRSFEIVKKIVNNVVIENNIEEASAKIKEGMPISKALSRTPFLPKLVLGMIAAGEASDNLDTMLLNIGKVYETELDLTLSSLTSMIEPIIIVVLGGLIGVIVIAVMLPMLEMNMLV